MINPVATEAEYQEACVLSIAEGEGDDCRIVMVERNTRCWICTNWFVDQLKKMTRIMSSEARHDDMSACRERCRFIHGLPSCRFTRGSSEPYAGDVPD